MSSSVEHDDVQLEAGLRAVLLTSRILIEPCGMGRSRLTHYCRADLRYDGQVLVALLKHIFSLIL